VQTQRRAYTLLEVILALTVLVVVAGIALPPVLTMYDAHKVRAATDTIRASWAEARSHAIEESRPYRYAVNYQSGNYRVAPDDASFWSGGSPEIDDQHPAFVREGELPAGIRFSQRNDSSSSGSSGQWSTVAVFQADGTAGDGCEIDVKMDSSSYTLTLALRGVTGTSTVRKEK
jgi:prepilin-type N-terminal cleavage/methylation domain-containing protein